MFAGYDATLLVNQGLTPSEIARRALSLGELQGRIKRFEIVELTIPNASLGRVSFTDQPQLRNQPGQIIITTGIEIYLDTVYSKSQFNNAVNGFAAADLPKGVFVGYVGSEESLHFIPLGKLNHINDFINPFQWDLEGFDRLSNLDWDKSYVQFSAAVSQACVLPVGVKYFRFKFDPANNMITEM